MSLPAGFPTPDRSGEDAEGNTSCIWSGKVKGHALRLRIPKDGKDRGWTVNEYEPVGDKVASTRYICGSRDFCVVMMKKWMETNR